MPVGPPKQARDGSGTGWRASIVVPGSPSGKGGGVRHRRGSEPMLVATAGALGNPEGEEARDDDLLAGGDGALGGDPGGERRSTSMSWMPTGPPKQGSDGSGTGRRASVEVRGAPGGKGRGVRHSRSSEPMLAATAGALEGHAGQDAAREVHGDPGRLARPGRWEHQDKKPRSGSAREGPAVHLARDRRGAWFIPWGRTAGGTCGAEQRRRVAGGGKCSQNFLWLLLGCNANK